jgi:hypothetical protein
LIRRDLSPCCILKGELELSRQRKRGKGIPGPEGAAGVFMNPYFIRPSAEM